MPHLSPLSWMTMSLLFWTMLLIFMSVIWWQQTPNFPRSTKLPSHSSKTWNWK